MDLLQSQSRDILSLATQRPTPAVSAEVMVAIQSKWEGVQASALKVLGRWADGAIANRLRRCAPFYQSPLIANAVGQFVKLRFARSSRC